VFTYDHRLRPRSLQTTTKSGDGPQAMRRPQHLGEGAAPPGSWKRLYPNLSDLDVPATNSGRREARPYDRPAYPLGRDRVYPRPHRTDRCSNLPTGLAQFRKDFVVQRAKELGIEKRPEFPT
jgi:hypothetical protein